MTARQRIEQMLFIKRQEIETLRTQLAVKEAQAFTLVTVRDMLEEEEK